MFYKKKYINKKLIFNKYMQFTYKTIKLLLFKFYFLSNCIK